MNQCFYNCSRYFFLILLFVLFSPFYVRAQRTQKIEYDASSTMFDESVSEGAFRLIDNVIFRHEGAYMYCDSAYFYPKRNSLDAYNNVRIRVGDSLQLYGDYLHYDGNLRKGKVRDNVRLISQETQLSTSELDFDFIESVGYYTRGANIINGQNNLKSKLGYYYSKEKSYLFKKDVVVINPDYTMYSNSLKYNTVTDVAYFLGPTEIISDSNYIYCEKGWYNTASNTSLLKQKAYIKNKEQVLSADSLYYERNTGYGIGYSNVEIKDSVENIILQGNYATYNQKTENSILTDSAVFIQISESDTLYLHADTLKTTLDSLKNKVLMAYYQVKVFRSNIQGKCDSLSYSFGDSTIRLFHEPVMWSESNQLSADYIEIKIKNKTIDKMKLSGISFIITQEPDTIHYTQIKGKEMLCFFKNNELNKINVDGNVQTIYYPRQSDNKINSVNKLESSKLIIYFKNKGVSRLKYISNPIGGYYPLEKISKEEQFLKDFKWLEIYRPVNKYDIFR